MKKSMHFRSWLLPVFLLAAAIVAGSCSKGEFLEPDAIPADGQTRAVPSISISCSPTPKGDTGTYLGLRQTYRFSSHASIILPPDPTNPHGVTAIELLKSELSIHASDGSTKGIKILPDDGSVAINMTYATVQFTAPGYYHVTATTQHNGATYQETKTYCVVSRADKITQPTSVQLGVPFNFSFNFVDPRYPDPTIEITESLFPLERFNTQYTILSNDGQGNYRLRIDQPGRYRITTGLGDGMYSAWSEIDVFFRPEKVRSESLFLYGDLLSGLSYYSNQIFFCDTNNNTYTSLPYRVYFTYELRQFGSQPGEPVPVFLDAGASGVVNMPDTQGKIEGVVHSWRPPGLYLSYSSFWTLTIPEDRAYWICLYEPDDGGGGFEPLDPPIILPPPGGGGGTLEPLDPPGGVIQ